MWSQQSGVSMLSDAGNWLTGVLTSRLKSLQNLYPKAVALIYLILGAERTKLFGRSEWQMRCSERQLNNGLICLLRNYQNEPSDQRRMTSSYRLQDGFPTNPLRLASPMGMMLNSAIGTLTKLNWLNINTRNFYDTRNYDSEDEDARW